MSELGLMPILKKSTNAYDFVIVEKKDDKILAEYFVFLKELVYISYIVSTKSWHYYPLKEDSRMGLMYWVVNDTCWQKVGPLTTKAYNDYIADKALLGNNEEPQQELL